MSQETVKLTENSMPSEPALNEKKQTVVREILNALRSVADDIGQINELLSEEQLLTAQFFSSLLKLMQPFSNAISVSLSVLPPIFKNATQAHVDPTGHLGVTFDNGLFKLVDLAEQKNLDLVMTIIPDILPKLKTLTSLHKNKIEDRIRFLSTVTKEMQKISDSLPSGI